MSEESHARQLVVFTLGTEQYALPIEQVHEIIRYDEPRSVASPIAVGPRRHQPARPDRPGLRPRRAARTSAPSSRDQTKIVIVEAGAETAGVIVDDVEEVLTVEDAQFEEVPGADAELIDAIAKIGDRLVVLLKPSTIFSNCGARRGLSALDPAQPRPVLRSGPIRWLACHRTPTRVVVADDSADDATDRRHRRCRGPGSRSSAARATATKRWPLCERERPDALMLDLAMPGLDGIGVLARAAADRAAPTCRWSSSPRSRPRQGARAVDALAAGAFDLVAKPAVGEGLDGVRRALVEKVARPRPSADRRGRATQRPAAPVRAAAPRGRSRRRQGRPDRHLDRRAAGARRADPAASRAARRRHADRAAHAARLHASLAARLDQGSKLTRHGGRGRRDARSARGAARPGRQAPARGQRRPHDAERRARDRRACARAPT